MPGSFNDSLNLAILAAGASPSWVAQPAYAGAPAAADAGTALGDGDGFVLKTQAAVDLRADPAFRAIVATVNTYDASADFVLTLGGTVITVASAGHSDEPELLAAMKTAIEANGTTNALITVVARDTNGDDTATSGLDAVSLSLTGKAEADYAIVASATGSGVWAIAAEASTATVRAYIVAGGSSPPSGWRLANNGEWAITRRNWGERLDTAGCARLYIEVADLAGPAGDGASFITYAPALVRAGPGLNL